MKAFFVSILNRFKEPSSWAGFAALLAIAGIHLPEAVNAQIGAVGAAVCGLLAVILPEQGS